MERTTFTKGLDDDLRVGVLFTKIDKENRIVSGFATLDNRDDHGDVISDEASRRAFARFRGGVREMHQPNAVGTIVKFEEARKYDPETDKVYNGVYVYAKVSKGAADTWEKVLDGTLKGFSIGGKMRQKGKDFDPETGDEYTVIKEYDLHEISLVDNPANPLATVLTVQKIGDQLVYSDEVLEKQVMNILLQPETGDVILSEDAEREGFENIGWTDSVENTDKIKLALDAYKTSTEDASEDTVEKGETDSTVLLEETDADILAEDDTDEGGATVGKKIEKQADEVVEQDATEVEEVDATAEVEENDADDNTEDEENEDVEKAADVTEVADDDDSADEIVQKVTAAVNDALAKAFDAAKESQDASNEVNESLEKTIEQFNEQISGLKASLKKEIDGLAKRVEEFEEDTAVKKSADVVDDDADEDDEDDNFWRGSGFLSASDLVK